MSEWRPIETAPVNGEPVLLYLRQPLDTNDALGWLTPSELRIVVGWPSKRRACSAGVEVNQEPARD